MRQSQAEIKAIEAELRSIRADSKVTLLDPHHRAQQSSDGPIAPTIDRQALMASQMPSQEKSQRHAASSLQSPIPQPSGTRPVNASKRTVECFPLPGQYRGDHDHSPNYSTGQTTKTRTHSSPRSDRTGRWLAFPAEQFDAPQSSQYQARLLLAEKANQINALSNQQEAVILELMSLSETLSEQLNPEIEPICEYRTAEVPYIETAKTGKLLLKSRAVDLSYLDSADENPRPHRSRRQRGLTGLLNTTALLVWQTTWQTTWTLFKTVAALGRLATAPIARLAKLLLGWNASTTTSTSTFTAASAAAPRRRSSRRSVETPFTLREAAVLVIGSALLRLGLDWLVVLYPMLWIPSILVMLTPAAIAVYRSTLAPPTGFAWGYRLFSIMIGLLLGGRL